VIESADIDHVRQRWFDRMDALRIKVVQAPPTASLDQPDVLRINAVLDAEDVQQIIPPLQEQFQDRLTLHGIVAPNYGVYFLEAFAVGVDKWSAVKYIAQGLGIGPGKVAAIGDDINDLPMIVGAGLGIAMPDASQSVRQQADRIAQAGLAEVLRDLLP
jgi:hydroxymethylpyrimidine pyrophosphatase-like HAD family hydrolase